MSPIWPLRQPGIPPEVGYGEIAEIKGNKLEIDFEQAGRKRVMDSFVTVG